MWAGSASPVYQSLGAVPDMENRKPVTRRGGEMGGCPAEGGDESSPCLSPRQRQTTVQVCKKKD